jgi:hypothetical protein
MRIAIILIAALWGIGAVMAFVKMREKTLDAKLTAGFILLWPALVVVLLLNEPVPMLVAVPTMFGFIPWLMAGPHLWQVVQDPSRSQPDEIMGIPKSYWAWGGLGAVLLGILFN